jgi:vacuolar-type H+-ATPase subunit F/Vma7
MEKIYIIGDMHTVSAFRLSGVEGVVSTAEDAQELLDEIVKKRDAGIVLVTNDLAANLQARIREINLEMPSPVVMEIPGIDDTEGIRKSAMGYISEALGISL